MCGDCHIHVTTLYCVNRNRNELAPILAPDCAQVYYALERQMPNYKIQEGAIKSILYSDNCSKKMNPIPLSHFRHPPKT